MIIISIIVICATVVLNCNHNPIECVLAWTMFSISKCHYFVDYFFQSKEGRFTDEEGVFMELINTRSISHIRATFQHYITVSSLRILPTRRATRRDFYNNVPCYWLCVICLIFRYPVASPSCSLWRRTDAAQSSLKQ